MSPDLNVYRLAAAQAFAGANSAVVYTTGAIIGHFLAPNPALATLPITVFVLGMATATLPIGIISHHYGRQLANLIGVICGVLMGLIGYLGLVLNSFWLFCTAMIFGGAYAAVVLTYRFAATEISTNRTGAWAISTVMAGGVLAGIFGPELVTATMNVWPHHAYAATYVASAVAAVISWVILFGVKFNPTIQQDLVTPTRPLIEIVREPRFLVAMICGVVSYMMMNFMMTAAPLAMELCGIPRIYSNYGIEMHIIAMYLPSFITGRLIDRVGVVSVIYYGLALIALSAIAAISGLTINHFWVSLVLLGLGWNFGFLGASALVLQCHTTAEAKRVQSINDFVVFGAMAIGSLISGGVLSFFGWKIVAGLVLPPVVIAMGSLMLLQREESISLPCCK
jgi:MFS family permease